LAKKAAAFFRKAFSISSSALRFRRTLISASTSDVDLSSESIALRSFTHLFAVLGFSPNSLQTSVVGLPVEMM
jgi:hypothetical protein